MMAQRRKIGQNQHFSPRTIAFLVDTLRLYIYQLPFGQNSTFSSMHALDLGHQHANMSVNI